MLQRFGHFASGFCITAPAQLHMTDAFMSKAPHHPCPLRYCTCPTARDWCCHVYGLVCLHLPWRKNALSLKMHFLTLADVCWVNLQGIFKCFIWFINYRKRAFQWHHAHFSSFSCLGAGTKNRLGYLTSKASPPLILRRKLEINIKNEFASRFFRFWLRFIRESM